MTTGAGLIVFALGVLVGVVLAAIAVAASEAAAAPSTLTVNAACSAPDCQITAPHAHSHDALGEHIVFPTEVPR
jgi:hypothetical protein